MRTPTDRGRGSGARFNSQNFARGANGPGRGRGRGNTARDLTPETVTGLFFLVNFLQLEYFPRTG
jgi:hypothetical protein